MGLTSLGPSLTGSDVRSRPSPAKSPRVQWEWQTGGWPQVTEWETAEIQAGGAFFLEIPHSITTSPFFQTGGDNEPVQLG